MRIKSRNNEGAALVVALLSLAIVTGMASAFFVMVHQAIKSQEEACWSLVAHSLAEAGIAKSLAMIQHTGAQYPGETETPLGDQTQCARVFSTNIQPGKKAGTYELCATGTLRNGALIIKQARIEVLLEPDTAGRFHVARWKE